MYNFNIYSHISCSPPQVFFMKNVIFELILYNTFSYKIMTQVKIIVQVKYMYGNSNQKVQSKRTTVKVKQKLTIAVA